MNKVMWTGVVDGVNVRIVRVAIDDCIVEEEVPTLPDAQADSWVACGDRRASHAYMKAFLYTHKVLDVEQTYVSRE